MPKAALTHCEALNSSRIQWNLGFGIIPRISGGILGFHLGFHTNWHQVAQFCFQVQWCIETSSIQLLYCSQYSTNCAIEYNSVIKSCNIIQYITSKAADGQRPARPSGETGCPLVHFIDSLPPPVPPPRHYPRPLGANPRQRLWFVFEWRTFYWVRCLRAPWKVWQSIRKIPPNAAPFLCREIDFKWKRSLTSSSMVSVAAQTASHENIVRMELSFFGNGTVQHSMPLYNYHSCSRIYGRNRGLCSENLRRYWNYLHSSNCCLYAKLMIFLKILCKNIYRVMEDFKLVDDYYYLFPPYVIMT